MTNFKEKINRKNINRKISIILSSMIILIALACGETAKEKKDKENETLTNLVVLSAVSRSSTTLAYSGFSGTLVLVTNSAMTSLTPTATNFTPTSYSVSPALPTGITLNTTTGVISGTPTTSVTVKTTYTITGTSSSASASVGINVLIGSSGAFTCRTDSLCPSSSRPISCSNDTNTCYSSVASCQASSLCGN